MHPSKAFLSACGKPITDAPIPWQVRRATRLRVSSCQQLISIRHYPLFSIHPSHYTNIDHPYVDRGLLSQVETVHGASRDGKRNHLSPGMSFHVHLIVKCEFEN